MATTASEAGGSDGEPITEPADGARDPGWYAFPAATSTSARYWNGQQWVGAVAPGAGATEHHVAALHLICVVLPLVASVATMVGPGDDCISDWAMPLAFAFWALALLGAVVLLYRFSDLRAARGTDLAG